MANPIQVMIVNADPLFSVTAVWATMEENCGESATTANPQINKKKRNNAGGNTKLKTDSRQQQNEMSKPVYATLALPFFKVI